MREKDELEKVFRNVDEKGKKELIHMLARFRKEPERRQNKKPVKAQEQSSGEKLARFKQTSKNVKDFKDALKHLISSQQIDEPEHKKQLQKSVGDFIKVLLIKKKDH